MNQKEEISTKQLSSLLDELSHQFDESLTPKQRQYLSRMGYVPYDENSKSNSTLINCTSTDETDTNTTVPIEEIETIKSVNSPLHSIKSNYSRSFSTLSPTKSNLSKLDSIKFHSVSESSLKRPHLNLLHSQESLMHPLNEPKKQRLSLPSDLFLKPISPDIVEAIENRTRSLSLKQQTPIKIKQKQKNSDNQPDSSQFAEVTKTPVINHTEEEIKHEPVCETPVLATKPSGIPAEDSFLSPNISDFHLSGGSSSSPTVIPEYVQRLSARSKKRDISEDSFSVAHVEYDYGDNEGGDNAIDKVMKDKLNESVKELHDSEDIPTERKNEHESSKDEIPLKEDSVEAAIPSHDLAYSNVDLININDCIPQVDDSLLM